MTEEQGILWLAGLLEGEGCFLLERDTKGFHDGTVVRIVLSMTDGDVVERAAAIMASSRVRRYRPRAFKTQHKDVYSTRVSGTKAVSVMRQILPFMGARRKAKIEQLLKLWEGRSTWSDGRKRAIARNKKCPNTESLFVLPNAS